MILDMQDENGNSLQAFVVDMAEDNITIDFNHPLAGKTLTFNIKIAVIV